MYMCVYIYVHIHRYRNTSKPLQHTYTSSPHISRADPGGAVSSIARIMRRTAVPHCLQVLVTGREPKLSAKRMCLNTWAWARIDSATVEATRRAWAFLPKRRPPVCFRMTLLEDA